MNPDLAADLEFALQRKYSGLRRRDYSGRGRIDTSTGRPVIAVGDVAAYESMTQAGKAHGVSGEHVRCAVCIPGYRAIRRPWMLATPPLLKALLCGGWPEAQRRNLVKQEDLWAVKLGRLIPIFRRRYVRNEYQARKNKAQYQARKNKAA